jgi:hypothetical protein
VLAIAESPLSAKAPEQRDCTASPEATRIFALSSRAAWCSQAWPDSMFPAQRARWPLSRRRLHVDSAVADDALRLPEVVAVRWTARRADRFDRVRLRAASRHEINL